MPYTYENRRPNSENVEFELDSWKEPKELPLSGIKDIKWNELYSKWRSFVPSEFWNDWKYYKEALPPDKKKKLKEARDKAVSARKNAARTSQQEQQQQVEEDGVQEEGVVEEENPSNTAFI